jgi:hypothetical protein
MSSQLQPQNEHRVRVWFGHTAIADYRAAPAVAARYEAAMSRRFAGLRVTNEPIAANDAVSADEA